MPIHVKFAGAQVKLVWKANNKSLLLACAITIFVWILSKHTGKTEGMVLMTEYGLRSNLILNFSWRNQMRVVHALSVPMLCPHNLLILAMAVRLPSNFN